jgi:hypothetical protein
MGYATEGGRATMVHVFGQLGETILAEIIPKSRRPWREIKRDLK